MGRDDEGLLVSCPSSWPVPSSLPQTPQEAWAVIQDNIAPDCGPRDEGWDSEELMVAKEIFHRLYSPHLTAKALFPNSPMMWPESER